MIEKSKSNILPISADLSTSCLNNAQLVNVRMVCANLESVSFRNCNFEGNMPSNLEGCNLKNAILEGKLYYAFVQLSAQRRLN